MGWLTLALGLLLIAPQRIHAQTWTQVASLGTARAVHSATLLSNGKVLVAGGYNGSAALDTAQLYDPANITWTFTANNMALSRYGHAAALLSDGKVLVSGGISGGAAPAIRAEAEVYDPATNSWFSVATMAGARYGHTATLLASGPNAGKVLVAGGVTGTGVTNSAELYDPVANSWTSIPSLTLARENHTAVRLNDGRVLVAGGHNGLSTQSSVEIFDPTTNSWSVAAVLTTTRENYTAALLANDKVLVAGGHDGTNALASAEIYDVASNSWSSANPMTAAREKHGMAILADGRALVAGGHNGAGVTASAEIYDPALNNWSALPSMSAARENFTATWLSLAHVLVAGGDDGNPAGYLNSAEIFATVLNQTIDFGALADKTFGAATFTLSATATSGLPVSFSAVGQCTVNVVTVTITGVGSCTITASQAGNTTYAAVPNVQQSFAIVKATPMVNWNNPADITPETALTAVQLNATASVNGNSVTGTFVYSPPAGAVLGVGNGQILHVEFTPSDTANYNNASKDVTINILKAMATLTLSNLVRSYDGTAKSATVTTSPLGLGGVSVTYDGSATAPTNAGSYVVLATLTNPNYTAPNASGTLVVNKVSPTVSVTGGSFPFDGNSHGATGFAYGVGGVGDVLSPAATFSYQGTGSTTYGPTATAPINAGTYSAAGNFAGNNNYTSASNSAGITIIDTVAPDTTITASPPAVTNNTSPSFSFTSTEAGSTFACRLDAGSFAACTSPRSYSALAAGSHSFQVQATDASGNTDPTPASFTWTIDTVAPDTTITASPPAVTNNTSPSFSFTSTEAGSTFACKLDAGSFAACTSPRSYSALAAGSHSFQVQATDAGGNTDPTPASFTWTIDTVAPDTTITASPPAVTNNTSPSFSFTSTEAGSTFACRLDAGSFAACTSPRSYSALGAGSHTFQVQATDAGGNTDPTPASFTWTIDTVAPDTTITASPPAVTNNTSPSFSFTSTEAGSTFACRLDAGSFAACTSPRSYSALGAGSHTFQVQATDAGGNTDPTPASFTWTIDTVAPDTTITASPPAVTNNTSPSFSFTSTEAGSTFACKLDAGSFAACTSPRSYSALGAGSHTFQVQATDAGGNTDPTPASFTWTINPTAPGTALSYFPMVGAVTDASANIWIRSDAAASATVQYQPAGGNWLQPLQSAAVNLVAGNDFTGTVSLTNLAASTSYDYRVILDGGIQPTSTSIFKTFPPRGAASQFSFVFGADIHPAFRPHTVFNIMAAQRPDFALLLGDSIYNTDDSSTEAGFWDLYKANRDSAFQSFANRTPIFTVWDDDDYGKDFGDSSYPRKQLSRAAFGKYWANPSYVEQNASIYYKFSVADVDFFMLDTRWNRVSGVTMLGAAQLQWLKDQLLASTAKFKFIVSSVMVSDFGNTGGDSWKGFPTERLNIFQFITANNLKNITFLSGDQHWVGAFLINHPVQQIGHGIQGFYEVEPTPLSAAKLGAPRQTDPQILFETDQDNFYGLARVDTTALPRQVQLEVRSGSSDAVVYSLTVEEFTPAQSPAIVTSFVPQGTTNSPYSQTLAAIDGIPPYQWQVSSGSPPPGLNLSANGVISGTPAQAGTFLFTATVQDIALTTANRTLSLVINSGNASAPVLNHDFSGTLLSAWTIVDEGTNENPSSWTISNGLLVQQRNTWGGSPVGNDPVKPGTYAYAGNRSWADYDFNVSLLSLDDDAIGVMFRYQDRQNYYRFSMDQEKAYRRLTKTVNGVTTILAQDAGAYQSNRWYAVRIRLSGNSIQVYLDGVLLFNVIDSSIAAGMIALYCWANPGSYFDDVTVVLLPGAPTILSNDLSVGASGVPYNHTLRAAGGDLPYSWILASGSLPPGLLLSQDGTISGTPTAGGTFAFSVQVRDNALLTAAKSFNLTITTPGVILSASPTSVAPGTSVTASWSGISNPTTRDWIGLYTPGAADGSYQTWIYVSCTQTPLSGQASGSCPFGVPSFNGTYELRIFANNSYTRLATSNQFSASPVTLPVVTIGVTDGTATEGTPADTGIFTVSRTGSTASALIVNYTVAGTATNGADYQTLAGSVVIAAGQSSATITVTTINDSSAEGNETVIATVSANAAYTLGSPASGTVTIIDDEPPLPVVTITVTDGTATEGTPADTGIFTVSRTGSTASALTVNYTVGGTATNGVDYQAIFGSVVIAAGQSSATITVTTINDSSAEGNETVIATLSANAAYTLGSPAIATVTIIDDEPPLPVVTITVTDGTATEGTPADTGIFTVSRTGSTAAVLTVSYTISGTASNGVDYQTLSGSVTIPAGQATATISVTPIDDSVAEGNETVVVTLAAGAGYTVGSSNSATVTIADNDGTNIAASSGSLAAGGTVTATWSNILTPAGTDWIALSTPSSANNVYQDWLYVSCTKTAGTARAGGSCSLTLSASLAPGTYELRLFAANDFTRLATSSSFTVTGPLPVVTIAATDNTASEAGLTTGLFTVSRTGSTTAALTVSYTVGGTASNGVDYQTLSGSVTIAANQPSATILVTPIDDGALEGDETVVVTLSANAAYTIGAQASATVTIGDDDAPVVTITASIANAAEPATIGQFTVNRAGSTAAGLVVNYTIGGTASNGVDYQTLNGSVTIPAGQPAATITVAPIDDSSAEGNETVVVTLSANANYTVGNPNSATVTIADNDGTTITASPTSIAAGGTETATWSNILTPTGTDWIALSTPSSANNVYQDWLYVSCTRTAGTARASGSCSLTLSGAMAPGIYELRLFAANGFTRLATSSPFTVTGALPVVTIVATDNTATEAGPTTGFFTVSRSGSTTSALTVNYSTSGTASNAVDYQTLSGSVIIPGNQASATILVTPIDDSALEGDETVIVTLSADAAYTIGAQASATVTVGDDDAPVVTVTATDNTAAEAGLDPGVFTVTRSGSTGTPLTVNYAVTGTATNGVDYQTLSGSITISAGQATATLGMTPIDDSIAEGNETLVLTLATNAGYTIGSPNSATVTIVDNEPLLGPTISAAPATIARGSSVTVTWSGIAAPSATDWIGLYTVGSPNSPFWAWQFVSCTTTAATPRVSGSCSLLIPISAPAGNFEVRLFGNNTFNRLATSGPLAVQ